jgi:hypothetical protein
VSISKFVRTISIPRAHDLVGRTGDRLVLSLRRTRGQHLRILHEHKQVSAASVVRERSGAPTNISASPPCPSTTRHRCPHPTIVRRGKNASLLHALDRLQCRFTQGCEGGSLRLLREGRRSCCGEQKSTENPSRHDSRARWEAMASQWRHENLERGLRKTRAETCGRAAAIVVERPDTPGGGCPAGAHKPCAPGAPGPRCGGP